MSDVTPEYILSRCEQAGPGPWFPSEEIERTGAPQARMNELLDELRMAGLIELSEWESGRGQGYRLTVVGREVLADPQARAMLRRHSEMVRSGEVIAPPPDSRREQLRQILIAESRSVVVPALIVLNVLNFLVGVLVTTRQGLPAGAFLSGQVPSALIDTGAASGELIARGEGWRLLSCCFVHIGAIHLFVNMLSLWFVGRISEQIWGRWRFLVIYLLAGVGGSWAAMMWNPAVTLAGASGAIWGILGALLAWVSMNRAHLPPSLASSWLRQLGGILLLNVFISFMPGISAAAHFGGGAVGFLVASLLNWQRFGSLSVKYVATVLILMIPLGQFVSMNQAIRNPDWLKLKKESNLVAEAERTREAINEVLEKGLVPLLALEPEQRHPEDIEQARRLIDQMRKKLDFLSDAAQKDLKAPDTLRTYLSTENEYLGLLEQKLALEQFWKEDQQRELREVKRRRDAAEKAWLESLGS